MIGCHHDLKPINVLVSGNRFLLADFGLSRLRPEGDGSGSEFKVGGGDYMAPECQTHTGYVWQNGVVGRSSDMWSFGCILAEIATYIRLGAQGVQEFSEKRKVSFYNCTTRKFHANSLAHPGVSEWLENLSNGTTGALRELLELSKDMLALRGVDRPKAEGVRSRVFALALRSIFEYLLERFAALLEISQDLELMIEWERFRIWGSAAGFSATEPVAQGEQPWRDQAQIEGVLMDMNEELDVIQSNLESGEILKPIYFQLRTLNDSLWNFPPQQLALRMGSLLQARMLDEHHLEAAEETFRDHSAYRDIGLLATIKKMTSLLQNCEGAAVPGMLLGPSSLPKFEGDLGYHKLGVSEVESQSIPVLVEWMVYETTWVGREAELIDRVNGVAKLLGTTKPTSFRVLNCAGFYHDVPAHRFGLVYKLPFSKLEHSIPITLRKLIDDTNLPGHRPLRGDTFALAHALAKCILEVHKVGWLHKAITAHNVIFFPDSSQQGGVPVGSPYLVGFNHSRPHNETAFTQGPSSGSSHIDYQHPKYQRSQRDSQHRFCPEYDYYSLGMVLLEMGVWRPLDRLTKQKDLVTLSPEELGGALMDKYFPALGHYMGAVYRDAVRACLNGEISATTTVGPEGGNHLASFQSKVVDPLSTCFA
jgi:serine/threonine protein kinase